MEHGTPTEQALVRNCISQGDAQHFDEIVQAITERGALEYTKKQAQAAIDQAILALQTLPDSPFKDALFALAEFEIHRQS
jgi:octaprenyl-diphosphate synthase